MSALGRKRGCSLFITQNTAALISYILHTETRRSLHPVEKNLKICLGPVSLCVSSPEVEHKTLLKLLLVLQHYYQLLLLLDYHLRGRTRGRKRANGRRGAPGDGKPQRQTQGPTQRLVCKYCTLCISSTLIMNRYKILHRIRTRKQIGPVVHPPRARDFVCFSFSLLCFFSSLLCFFSFLLLSSLFFSFLFFSSLFFSFVSFSFLFVSFRLFVVVCFY